MIIITIIIIIIIINNNNNNNNNDDNNFHEDIKYKQSSYIMLNLSISNNKLMEL